MSNFTGEAGAAFTRRKIGNAKTGPTRPGIGSRDGVLAQALSSSPSPF